MWNNPYAQVGFQSGKIWGIPRINQAAAGMGPMAQRMAGNNMPGGGYSPAQQQAIGNSMQTATAANADRNALSFARNAIPQDLDYQLQSQQAVANSGLRKLGHAQGRQRQELQQQDQMFQLLMRLLGGYV